MRNESTTYHSANGRNRPTVSNRSKDSRTKHYRTAINHYFNVQTKSINIIIIIQL